MLKVGLIFHITQNEINFLTAEDLIREALEHAAAAARSVFYANWMLQDSWRLPRVKTLRSLNVRRRMQTNKNKVHFASAQTQR